MGLFGGRGSFKDISFPPFSPKANNVAEGSSSRRAVLSDLFQDASDPEHMKQEEPCEEGNDKKNASQCRVELGHLFEDSEENVQVLSPSSALRSLQFQDVGRSSLTDRKSFVDKPSKSASGQLVSAHDKATSRALSARRDSIKRSLSRKMARSESRLGTLNIMTGKDAGSLGSSGSGRSSGRSASREGENSASNSNAPSPRAVESGEALANLALSPILTNTKPHISQTVGIGSEQMEGFETAYGDDDVFLVEEATRKDFDLSQVAGKNGQNGNWQTRSDEVGHLGTHHIGSNQEPEPVPAENNAQAVEPRPQKSPKARKRPPPLLHTNSSQASSEPASDWPQTLVFGNDGGFTTGGFRITAEGMVDSPPMVTREDSESQADGRVPQSDRNLVLIKSLKEFRMGQTIGAGAAGRVCLAEHMPSKKTMAIKIVNVYDKQKRNQLLKELETLATHVSRYLVRFYGAFYDGSGAVHIALEYMDHGCLASFVEKVGAIPERVVQMIASDCLRGLRFLHRHHVLHRDFKTANILLSRRLCCAKVSDFGLARDLNPGVSKVDTFVGTVAYMSPERLQGSQYTYASDIWALGVSIVECLLGRYPFDKPQNYFDYIEATMNANILGISDQHRNRFSKEALDFATLCTSTDPKRRPTAKELLEHPWITESTRDNHLFGSWLDECRIISMRTPTKAKRAT